MSWRNCSSCRVEIGFEQVYWECSVSTCTRARTGLFFCSVGCWEAHLPTMRHREAFAIEKKSPSRAEWARQEAQEAAAEGHDKVSRPPEPGEVRRRVVASAGAASAAAEPLGEADDEVLIVVSKLKKYIRSRSGMNTADNVLPVLSEHLRHLCDLAIRKAGDEGRKTVLDRDIRAILR